MLHAVEDAFDHVPPLVRLPVVIPWGRTVLLGRHDRRQAGRLRQQAGRIPLARASMGRCAPVNASGAAMERRPWAASCPSPGVLLQCLFDRFGSVFPQCGLMVFPGVVIVSR